MSYIVYALARVFVPVLFIVSGWDKLTNNDRVARQLIGLNLPFPRDVEPYLPVPKFEFLGYAIAMLEFFGGIMILLGLRARWAAVVLFFFTAVATFYFHNFWDLTDAAQIAAQRAQAFKNLSVMGALLMIAVMGSGAYSLDYPSPRSLPRSGVSA